MPKSLAREGRVHFSLRKTKQQTVGMLLEFRNIRKVGLKAYGIKLSNQEHCAWPFQNAIIAKALTNSVRSITYFCYLCEFFSQVDIGCLQQPGILHGILPIVLFCLEKYFPSLYFPFSLY